MDSGLAVVSCSAAGDWLRASRLNDAEMTRDGTGRDETEMGESDTEPVARWPCGVGRIGKSSGVLGDSEAGRFRAFQAQRTLVPYTNQANKGNGCVRDLLMTRDWWTLSAMEIYATMHKVGRS